MAGKKLWKVSASQIVTFLKCPRAWYNASVLGDREPQKPHQERGEAVHKELEHYLRTGEVRPSEYIAIVQASLDYLPKPANDPYWQQFGVGQNGLPVAGLMLEQEIDMPTYPGGPNFIGYMDLGVFFPDACSIEDHKTTSNFRYLKTPEELRKDVQMCSYAKWAALNSDYQKFGLKHYGHLMKGRAKCVPVCAEITRAEVDVKWDEILGIIKHMADWAELGPETADALPPSTDHCSDYGGCYYRTKCGFAPSTSFRRIETMAENTGLLAQMMNFKKEATATAAAPTTATPPIAQATAPAPTTTTTPAAQAPVSLAQLLGSVVPAAAKASTPATVPGMIPGVLPATTPATTVPVVIPGVLPATTPGTATPATATAQGTSSPILPPDAPSRVSTPEEVGPPPSATAAPADAPAAEEGKKRGRPRKATTAATATAAVTPVAATAPVAPATGTAAAAPVTAGEVSDPLPTTTPVPPAPVAPSGGVGTLTAPDPAFACPVRSIFIDCMPTKGWPGDPPVMLDEIMHSFEKLAAVSAQQPDYALIDYKAKAYLRMAIKVSMVNLPQTVIVTSSTPGAAEFLEVVTPYAKVIVRGIR